MTKNISGMKKTKNKTVEAIAQRLTELMISKIETIAEEWHKP